MTNRNDDAAGYKISTDPSLLDVKMIHKFLADSYWAKNIPYSNVEKSIQNSLCFGIYKEGRQVGFARVISDLATFAYLADVFILEEHRGKGLSKVLMDFILKHPDLQNLRRWNLVTSNAHRLYMNYGFRNIKKPETYMEILNPDVYERLAKKEDSSLPGAGNEKDDPSHNQQTS